MGFCLFTLFVSNASCGFFEKKENYYSFRFWVFSFFSFVCSTRGIVIARLATCTACIFRKRSPPKQSNAAAAGIWNNIIKKVKKKNKSAQSLPRVFICRSNPFQRYFGRQCLHHTRRTIFYCSVCGCCVCRCCCCFVFLGLILSSLIFLFYIEF